MRREREREVKPHLHALHARHTHPLSHDTNQQIQFPIMADRLISGIKANEDNP